MKTAGESFVTKVDHFQSSDESIMNNYLDSRSSSAEKRARIDLLDLKEQREGEAHIFFKSKIVRAKMFYANPKTVKYIRLNHFLKVEPPSRRQLLDIEKRFAKFSNLLEDLTFKAENLGSQDLELVTKIYKENAHLLPIERGVLALLAFQTKETVQEEVQEQEEVYDLPLDELDIFTSRRTNKTLKELVKVKDMEGFSKPILAKVETFTQTQLLERLSGRTEQHARNIATEVVKDILMATHYPPKNLKLPKVDEWLADAESLIKQIKDKVKSEAGKNAD